MNKKLSIIIPVLNQIDLAKTCYKEILVNNLNLENETEFIILDNGSDIPIQEQDFLGAKIVRNEKNIGVYPTFKQGFEVATGDVVAFLHSDVVIWQYGWNNIVLDTFNTYNNFGLCGFIGSNEIDDRGGRGGGTASNFQGREITDRLKTWTGSDWTHHGKHLTDYMKGAVVDGCVMILSRKAWNRIGYRKDFPPHHFYDRLISTQILEAGYSIGVLGIEFDHISGQTVNQEKGYQKMAWEWLKKNQPIQDYEMTRTFGDFDSRNYDEALYKRAEYMWLKEYRDEKHIVPLSI